MTFTTPDNTRKILTTLLVLALSGVACVQAVVPFTPTPSPTRTPVPVTATPSPTVAVSETEAETETATVRAALVNVRVKPGGEVVGQITAGTDVRVLGYDESGDWAHIEAPDGWVFVGCLSIAADGKGCSAK